MVTVDQLMKESAIIARLYHYRKNLKQTDLSY